MLNSLGALLRCNGIKVPRSRNPFSLSLLDQKNEQALLAATLKLLEVKPSATVLRQLRKSALLWFSSVFGESMMMKSNEPGVGSAGEKRDECDLTCPK